MTQAQLDKAKSNVNELLNKFTTSNGIDFTKKKHKNYMIIKYDKKAVMPNQYYKVGYLRSLVIDLDQGRIVCVGPNKSIPVEEIFNYSSFDEPKHKIQYEEFVDGVMINVFWDNTSNKWQYATRSNIGADIRFFMQSEGNKTFREMFEDALKECNVCLDVLPKCYCYSFVLQHPLNRIVSPVERPRAVLVEAHEITDNIITIYPHGFTHADKELREIVDKCQIPIPEHYDYSNIKEAREKHASRNTDFGCVGIILKNYATGWRAKVRNPVYEEVKALRGNSPKLQFLYLTLRHSGNVSKYLKFFNEHAKEFQVFREQIHTFTQNLYVNYVDCFIKKKQHVNSYPHQYKVCMTALHTKYLDELMPQGKHIHKGIVIHHFNSIPPQRQMYLLNYNYRK